MRSLFPLWSYIWRSGFLCISIMTLFLIYWSACKWMLSPINSYKINLCILILIYLSGILLWNGRECQFSRWHLDDSGTAEPFLLHACLLLPFILGKIHIHAVLLFCALCDLLKHPPLLWRLSWLLEHWVGPSTANGSWNNRPTIYLVQCGQTCAGAAGVYEVWISLRKNRSRLSPLKVASCLCVCVGFTNRTNLILHWRLLSDATESLEVCIILLC